MEAFIEKRAFDMGFKRLIGFIRPEDRGGNQGRRYSKQRKKPYISPFKTIPPSQLLKMLLQVLSLVSISQ